MRILLLTILLALSATTGVIAAEASTVELHLYSLNDYHLPVLGEAYPATIGLLDRAPGATFTEPLLLPGTEEISAEVVVDCIKKGALNSAWEKVGTGIEIRGNGILVSASPESQADVVQALSAYRSLDRPCAVHVDFGTIPAGEVCPTGIIPAGESQRLRGQLRAHTTLTASGCVDHLISARAVSEQPYTSEARIADGHLVPITAMLRRGRAVAANMTHSERTTFLQVRLSWVEDAAPLSASMIRCPEHTVPAAPIPVAGFPEKAAARVVPGEQFAIDLPALWTWRPDCDCVLLEGEALALCCEHGADQAVMLVSVESTAKPLQPWKFGSSPRLITCFYDISHCLRNSPAAEGPGVPEPGHSMVVHSVDGEDAPAPESEPDVYTHFNEIVEVIQRKVAPDSWKEGAWMYGFGGTLAVIQSEAVQAQIPPCIADIGRTRQRQIVVRWHRLTAPLAGNATHCDAQQWAAMSPQPASAVMVIRDGDSGYHFGGVQRRYLSSDRIVHDLHRPLVATVSSGTVLEVVPTIGADGVQVRVHADLITEPTWSTMGILDDHGVPLFTLARPLVQRDEKTEVRSIPKGGAALMQLGEHEFAMTAEVIDPEQTTGR